MYSSIFVVFCIVFFKTMIHQSSGTCPAQTLSNGRISYNRSPNNGKYPTWTRAFYYCNNGYALSSSSGVNRKLCNSAGHWSWGDITCVEDLGKNCPLLNLGNGTVEYSGSAVNGSYPPGIQAAFSCYEGYSLNGYFFIKCQVSGTWNQPTPICKERKTCQPVSLSNGTVLYNSISGIMTVSFSCNPGYALQPAVSKSYCIPSGDWYPSIPKCHKNITCPALSLQTGTVTYNQDKSDDGGYPMNTQATAECYAHRPVRLYGWRVRTCQSSGQWDGYPASCERRKGWRGGR